MSSLVKLYAYTRSTQRMLLDNAEGKAREPILHLIEMADALWEAMTYEEQVKACLYRDDMERGDEGFWRGTFNRKLTA